MGRDKKGQEGVRYLLKVHIHAPSFPGLYESLISWIDT